MWRMIAVTLLVLMTVGFTGPVVSASSCLPPLCYSQPWFDPPGPDGNPRP